MAPKSISCATVGQGIRPAGSPRYSRSSSGSGSSASLSMWLVEKPSIALATGMSESAEVRYAIAARSAASCGLDPKRIVYPEASRA